MTKAFGEALARMYLDRSGMEAICVRIGWFSRRPLDARRRATWLLDGAARRLGYEPRDDAERYAPKIEEPAEGPGYKGDPFTARGHGGWE